MNGRKGKVHDISYQKISLAFSRKGEVLESERVGEEQERIERGRRSEMERGGEGENGYAIW